MFITSNPLSFVGKVALITGAGRGLGKEYALLLASRGASIVVNDLGGSTAGEGTTTEAADLVVEEIKKKGGKAVPDYNSVENGHAIIQTAINNFGRIDIVINNAGILRDKSFVKITEQDWDLIHKVHLKGSFSVSKAAWPYFRKQNYGRIIMTSSNAGLFGNFGQTNYSSAKLGLVGLSNTLAVEGEKYNIHCNTVVPVAGSRLTKDILPPHLFDQLKPCFVAPLVVWLCHEDCKDSGGIFETAGGWIGKYTWKRSLGKAFIPPEKLTPESVRDNWPQIVNMESGTYPSSIHEQITQLVNDINGDSLPPNARSANQVEIKDANTFNYKFDDVILYSLGVGVSLDDKSSLKFLNESDENFSVLPTFGVLPAFKSFLNSDMLNKAAETYGFVINESKILHGEQYIEIKGYVPPEGSLTSKSYIVDVLDKGVGAVIIVGVDTFNEKGKPLFYNQFALFMVGSGNFGGKRNSSNPEVKPLASPPDRSPDVIVSQQTSVDQAALYRLSGDKNPLHIDPSYSAASGFEKPILHGLCTYGFATRHVLAKFANNDPRLIKAIKARFSGTIFPGQTIRTEMWKENNRIYFRSINQESGKKIIEGGYVDLKISKNLESVNVQGSNNVSFESLKQNKMYLLSDDIFENIDKKICLQPDKASKVDAIYQVNISKDGKIVKNWVLDFKSDHKGVYLGEYSNRIPNCKIEISDEDMVFIGMGELDFFNGYLNGQLNIQGEPMLTQRLNYLFEPNHSIGFTQAYVQPPVHAISFCSSSDSSFFPDSSYFSLSGNQHEEGSDRGNNDSPKCIMDMVFKNWSEKLSNYDPALQKEVVSKVKTVYHWNITKDKNVVSVWTCDFKNNNGSIYPGPPKSGKGDCILTIDDDLLLQIFQGKTDAIKAFMNGKLKIAGNILAAQKLQNLWSEVNERPDLKPKSTEVKTTSDPDVDAIFTTGLKADLIFNVLQNRCHEEPDFMKRLRATFQFNIVKKGNQVCVWTADNKSQPTLKVYRHAAENVKPDVTVTLEDEDLLKIMVGRINPQRLFMNGKVKVKGNIMLLQKLNTLWLEFQKLGKAPELPLVIELLIDNPLIEGIRSESMIIELIQRIPRLPELAITAGGNHVFKILKDGKVVSTWTLELNKSQIKFVRGTSSPSTSVITVNDYDFARLVLMKLRLKDAINSGIVQVEGDKESVLKLDKLFTTPSSLKPKL